MKKEQVSELWEVYREYCKECSMRTYEGGRNMDTQSAPDFLAWIDLNSK